MEVDDAIAEAIQEGIKAGVFWKAARLNPAAAQLWVSLAQIDHIKASTWLARGMKRMGVEAPGR